MACGHRLSRVITLRLQSRIQWKGTGRMENSITFVGMDTHKKEHSVALHYPGEQQIVRFTVRNTAREISNIYSP